MKKTDIAVFIPAVTVFLLTETMYYAIGFPEGLFLSRSIRGITIRFFYIVIMLLAPLPLLPRFLVWLSKATGNGRLFGQLATTGTKPNDKFDRFTVVVLRPLQGMGLSLVFAEKFLQLMEFSTGVSPSRIFIRLSLFMLGSVLVSLLLSSVWACDDLGIKSYNQKNGEVRLLGGTVGAVLPLITGILGISILFERDTIVGALTDLLGISMVLYPPYSVFAIVHYGFFKRRSTTLLQKLSLKTIQTNLS